MQKCFFLLSCFVVFLTQAQNGPGLFLETELSTKFSVNSASSKTIISGIVIGEISDQATYTNPVFGLGFSTFYGFNKHIALGLGIGLNICKTDADKANPEQGHDKINIPANLTARFTLPLKKNWFLFTDLRGGYQYSENKFDFNASSSSFLTRESGGTFYGIDVAVGRQNKKYAPVLKLGYEIYQSNQTKSIGYFTDFGISFSQDVNYIATYHLLKVGFAIIM